MLKLSQLSAIHGGKAFVRGSILAREGEPLDEMFILLKGSVGLYKAYGRPGELYLATLRTGEFYGEMSLFQGKPSSATAVAMDDCAALIIDKLDLPSFFQTQPEAACELVRSLCIRLESTGLQLERALTDAGRPITPVHVGASPAVARSPASAPTPPPTEVMPGVEPMPEPEIVGDPAFYQETQEAVPGAAIIGQALDIPLFLPGHKEYLLPFSDPSEGMIMEKNYTCPQCGSVFKAWAVRSSKLVPAKTEADRRVRYVGVDPIYYDVVVCPDCWYSATDDSFGKGARRPADVAARLSPFKQMLAFPTGLEMDTTTVFAGHYMALQCAPVCLPLPYIVMGKLWQKLSRLYGDCGDGRLELFAAAKAHENYSTAYIRSNISPRQKQQLCIIIAELALKLGNIKDARNFFFKAKTDQSGSAALKRHAEDRMDDIRALLGIAEPTA